jgi:LmbE family N-acetylglucosaminyl deacetylase
LKLEILVVVAHPDDVDFGVGGTIATWVAEGN